VRIVGVSTVSSWSAPIMRTMFVVLTLAALLLGVFAMHSMIGGHSDAVSTTGHPHADTAAHDDASSMSDTAGMYAATDAAPGATVPMVPCDESCVMGCALMAATCVIVFLLASLVLLARTPAVFARVLDAGPRLARLLPRARFHIYLPSLTVLSISRT
jgi:hypothetical protein